MKKIEYFTLRDPKSKKGGNWDRNLPRVNVLNVSWNHSWNTVYVPGQPNIIEFVPMVWSARSMDKQNWIAGYVWFSFSPDKIQGTSSALFDKEEKLTACGKFYASVTPKNPDKNQA